MKSISLFSLLALLVCLFACKKNDNKENNLEKLIKQSGDDSLIAQVVYYDANGTIIGITDYNYSSSNTVEEINIQKKKIDDSYKLWFMYSANNNTIICTSNVSAQSYTEYFKDNRLVEKKRVKGVNGSYNQSIYFFYNLIGEVIEELNIVNEVDTSRLAYTWNNDNIQTTTLVKYDVVGVFKYDTAKPFMIGDVFYIYFLERFGRIPFKANANQCINEVVNEISQLNSWRDISYSYDSKGRISGYTISNNGGSVKYIYR